MAHKGETSRKETLTEIQSFLSKLRYAIDNRTTKVQLIQDRHVDKNRDKRYTNRYTLSDLFPNDNPVEALKRELRTLKTEEYIETVKDLRFPDKSEMRVFGKIYTAEEVYIKIRVELISLKHAYGDSYIMVMSFHYSDRDFNKVDFPYKGDV
jgi:hypothetical protein